MFNLDDAQIPLVLAHASVNVDILCADKHGTVSGDLEPTVDLPDQVQEDDERQGQILVEKGLRAACRVTSDREQSDVERSHQTDDVQKEAQPAAPDAKGCLTRC